MSQLSGMYLVLGEHAGTLGGDAEGEDKDIFNMTRRGHGRIIRVRPTHTMQL